MNERQLDKNAARRLVITRHDLGALRSGDYLTSFGLDRRSEELAAVTALAHRDGLSFELSRHVEQIYQRALTDAVLHSIRNVPQ